MNPDQPSRDQIETRLTALLLGELPADEAALLRYTMAQEPALQQLHDELQATLGLVREAAKHPADALVAKNAPLTLKLSAERRQQLLAQFKTPRPKASPKPLFWLKRIQMPTPTSLIVTALIIVFVLGLAAISIPNFVKARSTSASNAVINNLRQMDAAKQEWAFDNKKSGNDVPTRTDLTPYLRNIKPVMGETYVLGKVSEPVVADVGEGVAKKQLSSLSVTMPQGGRSGETRAQYGSHELNARGTRESLPDLAENKLPANRVSQKAMAASQVPPPSDAPVMVTLAPEPQLAPAPVATPPVEIVLPPSESAPEITAPAGAPVEVAANVAAIGGASPPISPPVPAGSVPPPGETAAGQMTLNYRDSFQTVDKLDRTKHTENQWTVPAQAFDSTVNLNQTAGGTGGGGGFGGGRAIGGQDGQDNGAVVGIVNSFSGAGSLRNTGQGGGGSGFGMASGDNNGIQPAQSTGRTLVGEAAPPAVAPPPFVGSTTPVLALNNLGLNRSIGGRPPYQGERGFPTLGPIGQSGGEPAGVAPLPGTPAASATPQTPTITPNGISPQLALDQNLFTVEQSQAQLPKAELPKMVNAAQLAASGTRDGKIGGVAGNRFYRSPAQESEQEEAPLLGNIPIVGTLFQGSAQPSKLAPVAAPAPATPAPPAATTALDSDFTAGAPTVSGSAPDSSASDRDHYRDAVTIADKADREQMAHVSQNLDQPASRSPQSSSPSENSLLQQRSFNANSTVNNNGATVAFNTAPVPDAGDFKSGEASDSFITGVTKEKKSLLGFATAGSVNLVEQNKSLDAERTRELQDIRAKRKDGEGAQQDVSYEAAQRDLQQKLKMHELLYSKLEMEKVDLSLPEASPVQITDRAQPGRSQNFWQRLSGQVESKARVKVESDVTDIPGMASTPSVASFDPHFVQTTFEIIRSEAVLGKVVDALNLQSTWASKNGGEKLTKSEAIAALKQRLDLQTVENTKLIEIGAKSSDPKEAADIANAVANAYADYRVESRQDLSTNGIAVLEDQFGQQTKEIQLAQAEVDRLGKAVALKQNQTEPAPEPSDLSLRKPAPNAPVPQPEILTRDNNLSTFSLNVSDVSFKFAEANLQNGKLPDTASIRSEEFINAFDYRDPEAAAGQPMAFTSERARYPFAHNRELLRFAVKTAAAGRPVGRALNLVLLLDNSGSMERADRVAIIRESLRVLATQLQPQDTVSVVTFARTARLWADGISGDKAGATLDQVGGITPEGGTNLEEAMRLAYETAHRHYLPTGLNRVVLLTDGAANLGNVEPEALKQKVEAQRKQGIALDCFGIGWEDYNDDLLEQLSSHGDGRYAFLNSPEDVSKDFAAKLAGALQIAAADVKVQVEFNPGRVLSYRQIGYARHQLTKEQFRDNTVAAGEIAAQEAGNALYTIETNPNGDGPIATVHVRYRIPGTTDYREHSWDVAYTGGAPALDQSSPAMRLAATASAFSEWLAASPYAQEVTLDELLKVLSGVPEVYGADDRPKQLESMIREAKSLEGK